MSAIKPVHVALARQLSEQLHRRAERAIAEGERTLDREPAAGDELTRLRALIGALSEGRTEAIDDHEAGLARMRQRFEDRFTALARIQSTIAELRDVTSPSAMLSRAPQSLCRSSTLSRAMLSLVHEGTMVAQAAYFEGDSAGAARAVEELRAHPIALEHPLIETELLRRRRATIVEAQVHPRVDRRMAAVMGWHAYAAAPVPVGAEVIAVLHADRGPDTALDVLDRDVLWEFASGLGQAYESASLRRMLRHERDQMRQFLDWVGARSSTLTAAPITLAPDQPAQLPAPESLDAAPAEGRDDRVVFAGLLTRRELDVLRLLADGGTNRAIAAALVVSDATVKYHVNSILRKLHVANRAEAVARYLTLLGMPPP